MIDRHHDRCPNRSLPTTNRRDYLKQVGGFGLTALTALLAKQASAEPQQSTAMRTHHFRPRAKSVIWLFMEGGPSGFDLLTPNQNYRNATGNVSLEFRRISATPGHFCVRPTLSNVTVRVAHGLARNMPTWPSTSIAWHSSSRW